jgi:hypothetical protein
LEAKQLNDGIGDTFVSVDQTIAFVLPLAEMEGVAPISNLLADEERGVSYSLARQ